LNPWPAVFWRPNANATNVVLIGRFRLGPRWREFPSSVGRPGLDESGEFQRTLGDFGQPQIDLFAGLPNVGTTSLADRASAIGASIAAIIGSLVFIGPRSPKSCFFPADNKTTLFAVRQLSTSLGDQAKRLGR
jgi:hypothetical protein